MNQTGFAVSQFKNRNGITSWRVAGWLHGVRIRKNFKTQEEAAAEKAALGLKALQAASGLRATATSLSNEQIREAEAVFRRLEGRTRSLSFYVDFALTNYRDPIRDISVADATKDYVALREVDFKQGNLSKRQFTSYRCELRALEIWSKGKTVTIRPRSPPISFRTDVSNFLWPTNLRGNPMRLKQITLVITRHSRNRERRSPVGGHHAAPSLSMRSRSRVLRCASR